jgi:hypothetical protein
MASLRRRLDFGTAVQAGTVGTGLHQTSGNLFRVSETGQALRASVEHK